MKIGAKESNNATVAIDVTKENKALKIDNATFIKPQINKRKAIMPKGPENIRDTINSMEFGKRNLFSDKSRNSKTFDIVPLKFATSINCFGVLIKIENALL